MRPYHVLKLKLSKLYQKLSHIKDGFEQSLGVVMPLSKPVPENSKADFRQPYNKQRIQRKAANFQNINQSFCRLIDLDNDLQFVTFESSQSALILALLQSIEPLTSYDRIKTQRRYAFFGEIVFLLKVRGPRPHSKGHY